MAIGPNKFRTVFYEHMFVESAKQADRGATREQGREALALLAERTRPVAASQTRLLPVLAPLAGLFPEGSLRRGSTIVVGGAAMGGLEGGGAVSLALSLLAATSATGSWAAVVGLPGIGAMAAQDLGVDLARLAVVPHPGIAWAEVTAALVDGLDMVVLCPPFAPRPTMARRLVARVRDRRSVLIVVPGRAGWPEHPDVHLRVSDMHWDGIGTGEGYLCRRRVTVTASVRRAAVRSRHHHLWLPSSTGEVVRALEGSAFEGDATARP
jgi:hypothetical protein